VKQVIQKWLHLSDHNMIDVMVAVLVANKLRTDPSWLLFVAPPSHAKTELVISTEGHPSTCLISTITPTTLVSGMRVKKGQAEPSLLPKLDGKVIVLKDFTSVLSMRSDAQAEILAQLREVYDGQYSKAFGTGKKFDWRGHVGLIGCVTPVYDKHYAAIGTLGDRFLLYRTHAPDARETGRQAQRIVGREDEMRSEIRDSVHKFLNQFDDLSDIQFRDNPEISELIVDLACFVAMARLPVERDYRTGTVLYLPLAEGSPRLTKQLMQLGMGLCIVRGKDQIGFDEFQILKKVARDLLPAQRLKIIQWLYDEGVVTTATRKTKEIAEGANLPTTTAKLICEDLMIVGVLDRDVEDLDKETSPYKWRIADGFYKFIQGSGVLNIGEVPDDVPF
jgi:hypothetical protein